MDGHQMAKKVRLSRKRSGQVQLFSTPDPLWNMRGTCVEHAWNMRDMAVLSSCTVRDFIVGRYRLMRIAYSHGLIAHANISPCKYVKSWVE